MNEAGAPGDGAASGMLARVRVLFAAALELPAGERTEFLTRACDGDTALEREVRSLLAYVEKTTFAEQLESGAEAVRGLGGPLVAPPERIGEFRIVRFLASGGMGRVYEAEQERPKRRVALKILGHGGADPAARRRFEREADLLAVLDHPGIARIYAAGVEMQRGPLGELELPWLAMELIEDARDLTRFAREEALPLRARLELLAAVCDAVQAGHRSGVVHRDLKPANLLVDRAGQVHVIDFGVACLADREATQRTLATATGALIGTLQYMAPEQIGGEDTRIDTRTDVYALGVVLHELVSGALPYAAEARALPDLARAIRDKAPRRLKAATPGVPADLDAIAWRALEKEPARRQENAAELAADLRRFVRGEPVLARAPSAVRAALFFARRYKLLVGAALALLLVSTAAAIVSARYARDAEDARAAAEVERDVARSAERTALDAGARAQRLFASQLDLSLAFVFDYHARLRAVDGTLALQSDMIANAIENLERL
ncbi:MAG: serine/threonine protein kinase [Planctomycetes bacterium]|nr:serine/threonine protein kinase [Planctomycetota bacterium]